MRTARTARIGTGGIGIIDTITEADTAGLSVEAALPERPFCFSCNDRHCSCIMEMPAAPQTLIYERVLVDRS
jgi:hypothetical protein